MTLKSLATIPTALLTGIAGPLGIALFERLVQRGAIESGRGTALIAYAIIVVVPFLVFVIGVDPKRWDGNYWFSQDGKTDQRRTWIRWAAYFAGGLVGFAL
jgi:hypothetical protein